MNGDRLTQAIYNLVSLGRLNHGIMSIKGEVEKIIIEYNRLSMESLNAGEVEWEMIEEKELPEPKTE